MPLFSNLAFHMTDATPVNVVVPSVTLTRTESGTPCLSVVPLTKPARPRSSLNVPLAAHENDVGLFSAPVETFYRPIFTLDASCEMFRTAT